MTSKQIEWINDMNKFCNEKFDMSYSRTSQEAIDYINRNLDEYQMLSFSIGGRI